MSMTDLEMNLGVHTTQDGFPFSDAIETLMLYEFRQLDNKSKKTVIRVSYSLDWINKPLMIAKLVENMAEIKVTESISYTQDFLERQCSYISQSRKLLAVPEEPMNIEGVVISIVCILLSVVICLITVNFKEQRKQPGRTDLPIHNDKHIV